MKKAILIRALVLLLAALMILPAVVACGPTGEEPEQTESTTTADNGGAVVTTTVQKDEYGRPVVPDDLPESMNLDRVFTVHTRGGGGTEAYEWLSDGTAGDNITTAVYKRNTAVEDRLGIDIEPLVEGTYANYDETLTRMRANITSNAQAYDLIAGFSRPISTLVTTGLLHDLNNIEYLNFEKPWWNKNILETMSIADKAFFANGALSTSMLWSMYVIVFNRDLLTVATAASGKDVYDLVATQKWTVAEMIELGSKVYNDANGDSQQDNGDTFGITFKDSDNTKGAYLTAFGVQTVTRDVDGNPMIDLDVQHTQKVITAITDLMYNTESACKNTNENTRPEFWDGNVLFQNTWVIYVTDYIGVMMTNYGLLPMPKLDEAQANYRTGVQDGMHLYCIPVDVADPSQNGLITEALAAESYRSLLPVYFEVVIKTEYSQDQKDSQMIDIIYDSIVFDMGVTYNDTLKVFGILKSVIGPNASKFSSSYNKGLSTYRKNLNKLITDVKAKYP
ncbi:MAG: extracellular solute-binding protein [Clostridia bacterium]|nr:extracellular solute-binding protein [Clostridia bacterium]